MDTDTRNSFIIKMVNFLKPFPSSDLNKLAFCDLEAKQAFVTVAGHLWTGEARPAQSSLSAGALCYRAWAQSWSSAGVEAHSVPSLAFSR